MLHDRAIDRATNAPGTTDRRQSDRVSFPSELVVQWHHEPDMLVRYEVIDASDGGYRVRSSLPMVKGMTGIALRLLPEGTPLNRSVMVAWTGQATEGSGSEFGLNFIEAV